MKNLRYVPLVAISFLLVISSACSSDSDESEDLINQITELQENLVETQEQISFLRKYACDQIQGFILSEPLEIDKFEKLLIKNSH